MPFELLDMILGGIMLLSALLALTRGFTREVLSLVSWGLAAAAGLFAAFNADLVAFALDYVQSDVIARIAVGGFGSESSSRVAASPDSKVKSPCAISRGSSSIPAARTARW